MRGLLTAAMVGVLSAASAPALACDQMALPAQALQLVEANVAATLVRNAASVEVAVAERARLLDKPVKRAPAAPGSAEALSQALAEAATDPAYLGGPQLCAVARPAARRT